MNNRIEELKRKMESDDEQLDKSDEDIFWARINELQRRNKEVLEIINKIKIRQQGQFANGYYIHYEDLIKELGLEEEKE